MPASVAQGLRSHLPREIPGEPNFQACVTWNSLAPWRATVSKGENRDQRNQDQSQVSLILTWTSAWGFEVRCNIVYRCEETSLVSH